MSKVVLSADYQRYSSGQFWADNNVANKGTLVNGVNYTQSISLDSLTFPDNTVFSWSWPVAPASIGSNPPSTVYSDPQITYGSSPWGTSPQAGPSPTQLANLTNLTANYSLAYTGSPQNLDVFFDLWFTSTPNGGPSTIQDEVTVWLHAPSSTSASSALTFSDPGYTAPISINYNSGGHTYIDVRPSTDHLSGSLNISDVIKTLMWDGVVTGNEYLSGVTLDAEPRAGTGSLTINNLSYNWQSNQTTTIDSSNSLSVASIGGNHILGNGAADTVIYSGTYAQYQIKQSGSETLVMQSGTSNLDALQSVAFIKFADGTYNVAQNLFVPLGTGPAITQISASVSQGTEVVGSTLQLTLQFNEAITLAGGPPTLSLNDGAVAVYDAVATAALGDPTKLVFDYTVAAGQSTNALAVTGFVANGASITDQAGNVANLSTVTSNLGGEIVVAGGGAVPLSLAQALGAVGGLLNLLLPPGTPVTVSDTSTNISKAQLGATQIAALGALGVKSLVVTDYALTWTSAQQIAFGSAGISVTAPAAGGTTVTTTWNADGSVHELLTTGITGQKWTSTDMVHGSTSSTETWTNGSSLVQTETWNADGTRSIHFYGVTGQPYTNFVQTYTAAGAIHDNHYYGITGQAYTDYDVVYLSNGKPTSATFSNGMTEAWTYSSTGALQELAYKGITGQKWTSTDTVYGATSTTETWSNGSTLVQTETWNNITGTHDIHFYGVTGQPYTNFDQNYNANGTIHDNHYYGITGQAYTDYDVVYAANGKPVSATYSNGMTETWSYTSTGTLTQIMYQNVTGQSYTSITNAYDAHGNLALTTQTNTGGTLSSTGHENSLTIAAPVGNDTIVGGGTSETFSFGTSFGHDTLADFTSHLSGTGHDTLSLPSTAFGGNFVQLLAATTFNSSGAVITLDSNDSITIPGLSHTAMAANPGSFTFHK